ncbi:MAG: FkbM family methyltransferase [Phycisphaerae bacterium]
MPASSVLISILKAFPHGRIVRRLVSEIASRSPASVREGVASLYNGQRMRVDLADYIGQQLAAEGSFELTMVETAMSHLKPGDVFIDVGAHMGFYSLVASRAVGAAGSVHAFEPGEKQHRLLSDNVRMNNLGNVRVNKKGVSNKPGSATFVEGPSRNLGESYVSQGGQGGGPTIDLVTLDDYCREQGITQLGGMKVDVEGLEEFVFQGAQDVLSRLRPRVIIYESVEAHAAKFGSSPDKVHAIIRGHGYAIRAFRHDKVVDPATCTPPAHDFIATLE